MNRDTITLPQGEPDPVAWAEEIIEYLHTHYDTEMIKELDSGDALIRLDDAIAAVEEVAQRYTVPQPPRQPLTDEEIKEQRDELLEALIDMVDYYGTASANVQQLDAAKSAIAKATGETK